MNAAALLNMKAMFVTLAVFQAEMLWLNAAALENIFSMVVTLAVFQAEMFALNELLSLNKLDMSVTALTFQSAIETFVAPCVHVVKFPLQALRADVRSFRFLNIQRQVLVGPSNEVSLLFDFT